MHHAQVETTLGRFVRCIYERQENRGLLDTIAGREQGVRNTVFEREFAGDDGIAHSCHARDVHVDGVVAGVKGEVIRKDFIFDALQRNFAVYRDVHRSIFDVLGKRRKVRNGDLRRGEGGLACHQQGSGNKGSCNFIHDCLQQVLYSS